MGAGASLFLKNVGPVFKFIIISLVIFFLCGSVIFLKHFIGVDHLLADFSGEI